MVPRVKPPTPALLERLRSPSFLSEAQRKAIHLSFIVLPFDLLFETLHQSPPVQEAGQAVVGGLGLQRTLLLLDLLGHGVEGPGQDS